jgi:hypothetical protein
MTMSFLPCRTYRSHELLRARYSFSDRENDGKGEDIVNDYNEDWNGCE